jgi:hypothetical protein
MTAYYYIESGKVKQINLAPAEYIAEAAKHDLYRTPEQARTMAKLEAYTAQLLKFNARRAQG